MFKTKLLLSVALSALMLASCTSETDDLFNKEDGKKITRIYVGTEEAVKTKTVTNPTTHAVTWEEGDEIALVDVSNGTYQKFVWSEYAAGDEGVTNEAAFFVAAEGEPGLTIGSSYKVIYPYSSMSYDGENDIFQCNSITHVIDNLKKNDWLYSDAKTVSSDEVPAYKMHHAFALVKVNLTINTTNMTNNLLKLYLRNITLRSQIESGDTRYPLFAYWVNWGGNSKDFYVYDKSNAVSSYIAGGKEIRKNNNAGEVVTFWLPVCMNAETVYDPMDVIVYWSSDADGNVQISCSAKKNLTAPLAAGNLYELNATWTPNDKGDAGTVELH